MASDILSYNVVQDHEGISIKGYRGLRPPGDLIYSDLSVLLTTLLFTGLFACTSSMNQGAMRGTITLQFKSFETVYHSGIASDQRGAESIYGDC